MVGLTYFICKNTKAADRTLMQGLPRGGEPIGKGEDIYIPYALLLINTCELTSGVHLVADLFEY